MADLQGLVDTLANLDDESAVTVITSVLQARPELAPPVVTFAVPDLTYPPQKALVERRSQGLLKSINVEKGFGFIQCEELHNVFGKDVFLHHSQFGGFQPGTPISFAVVLNKDNKPQAYDLQLLQDGKGFKGGGGGKGFWKGGPDMMQGDEGGFGKSKGFGKDFGKGGKEKGKDKSGHPNEVTPLGVFIGNIKSFNPSNGYGFIDCPELKSLYFHDVFLHHQQLADFAVGEQVHFTAYLNNAGKPQGKDLKTLDGATSSKRQRTDGDDWGSSGGSQQQDWSSWGT